MNRFCPSEVKTLRNLPYLLIASIVGVSNLAPAQNTPPAQRVNHDLGFDDTPMLPGLPYHVHDSRRPHPPVVTPAPQMGGAPSDATILFDGKDFSKWTAHRSSITRAGATGAPEWKLENGYMEAVPKTGDIATKDKFGDCQLHIEWATPVEVNGSSQARGNSGVLLMGRYEIQVLDSYRNPTYADGQAGAIYGQWPPLANATRAPGEWQSYDIVFEAPKFEGGKLSTPAYFTVFLNGILLHNRQASIGADGIQAGCALRTPARRRLARVTESQFESSLSQYLDPPHRAL